MAGLLEVLRQHGPHPPPHAPERRASRVGRPGRQAGVVLFPAAAQQRRQQFPLHLHGLRTRHHPRPGPQVHRQLEQGRKRHPRSIKSLSSQGRHRLAHRSLHPPRPRFALHLRTAVGFRRLRHVSKPRRRPRSAVVAARQRHAQGQAPGHRLHHRPTRLGEKRGP